MQSTALAASEGLHMARQYCTVPRLPSFAVRTVFIGSLHWSAHFTLFSVDGPVPTIAWLGWAAPGPYLRTSPVQKKGDRPSAAAASRSEVVQHWQVHCGTRVGS